MENERDDSMEDMIGVGGVPRFQLSKMSTISYGGSALLDHHPHHHDQNLLEGIITSSNNNNNNKADHKLPFVATDTITASGSNSNTKRTLPSLYWNVEEEDHVGGTSSKRLSALDDNNGSAANSITTLLNQLPQTPSLHHQAMLSSYPYPIPGMNWYA